MAPTEVQLKNRGCKKCKRIPNNGLKCVKCGSESHPGCLKCYENIIYNEDNTVICCESILAENKSVNRNDLETTGGELPYPLSTDPKEIEIYYLKQLLKQKDDLIENLNDKILTLKDHISLLHEINSLKNLVAPPTSVATNYRPILLTDEKNHRNLAGRNMHGSRDKTPDTVVASNSTNRWDASIDKKKTSSISKNDTSSVVNKITSAQVSTAIYTAQQNISKNPIKRIVGNNKSEDSVSAKHLNWFVAKKYKLSYSKDQLQQTLASKFPGEDIIIEELSSKYYNTFKIGVEDHMTACIEDPNNWPEGIEISQYFFRRNKNNNFGRRTSTKLHSNRWRQN